MLHSFSLNRRISLPKKAQAGNMIRVLFGCDAPLVLREESGHHLLIREWYVRPVYIYSDIPTKIVKVTSMILRTEKLPAGLSKVGPKGRSLFCINLIVYTARVHC
jgi:hypothetical protein